MNLRLSRRAFLHSSLSSVLMSGVAPQILPFSARAAASPNRKVQVAAIGVGPQGQGVMSGILAQPQARVVAVVDVLQRHREQAAQRVNDHYHDAACQPLHDFREVLARPDIDAVMIATPDHWHVPIARAAALAGKDIYLEKPMGLSLAEDQALRHAVLHRKRIFQFGTQQRSSREFQRAVELVRNGRIGQVKRIHVWAPASMPGGPTGTAPVPAGLDYEFWLGPAPASAYTRGKALEELGDGIWKTWWYNADYALGFIAGWGVHPLDIALWGHPGMMKGPMTIEGTGVIPTQGAANTAVAWDLTFTFADGVVLHYKGSANGEPPRNSMNDFAAWTERYGGRIEGHGTAFEGTDGWVEVHRGGCRTHPESLAEDPEPGTNFRARRSDSHQRDWIESILERRPAVSGIEESVQADLLCHLSDLAIRLGRKLVFDPLAESFVKDEAANRHLKLRPMRGDWWKAWPGVNGSPDRV